MARWVWVDPVEGSTQTMGINPRDGGSPRRKRRLTARPVTAPGVPDLVFEGEREVLNSTATGRVLTQEQYEFLENLWRKPYFLQVTDDESRVFQVLVKRVDFKPLRSRINPWKHDFTLEYRVVGGSGV